MTPKEKSIEIVLHYANDDLGCEVAEIKSPFALMRKIENALKEQVKDKLNEIINQIDMGLTTDLIKKNCKKDIKDQ